MIRNEVIMTIANFSFMILYQLGFQLRPSNRKPTKISWPITTLIAPIKKQDSRRTSRKMVDGGFAVWQVDSLRRENISKYFSHSIWQGCIILTSVNFGNGHQSFPMEIWPDMSVRLLISYEGLWVHLDYM